MKICSAFVLVVSLIGASALHAQVPIGETPIPKSEIQDHTSIYEAYLSNMLAWESGDLLVKVTRREDSTERVDMTGNVVFEVAKLFRIRFDHLNQRYLCLRQLQFEYLLVDHPKVDPGAVPKKRLSQAGFSWLDGEFSWLDDKLSQRKLPGKIRRSQENLDLPGFLKKFMIPEFRSTGLISQASGESMAHLNTIITKLASGHCVTKAGHTLAGNLRLVRRSPVPLSDQVFETLIEFDTKTFMPLRRISDIEVSQNGKRKLVRNFEERVTWQEIEGVFVPKSLINESTGGHRIGSAKFGVDESVEMEFRWISFNKEMKDKDFAPEHLENFENLLNFDLPQDAETPGIYTTPADGQKSDDR